MLCTTVTKIRMLGQVTANASVVGAAWKVALENLSVRRIRMIRLAAVTKPNASLDCFRVASLERAFKLGLMQGPYVTFKTCLVLR